MYNLGHAKTASSRLRTIRLQLLFTTVMLGLAVVVAFPAMRARMQAPSPAVTQAIVEPALTATPSPSPTLEPSSTPSPSSPTVQDQPSAEANHLVILAIEESGYSHLFAYRPGSLPLTRLTAGEWDDIHPALSPDGAWLAFASNRTGAWDLYRMATASGEIQPLTSTPDWEASPTWSADSRWLAYEVYTNDNGFENSAGGLDIYIRSVDGGQSPIRLTDHPAADYSPAWSPLGRQIAFVSTRSGESEIWTADLDRIDDRFQNISRSPLTAESHPAWSPDGLRLAWSSHTSGGISDLYVWDGSTAALSSPGSGDWPVWSPDGQTMLAFLATPNQVYLTGYGIPQHSLVLPPLALVGQMGGLTWGKTSLLSAAPPEALQWAGLATPGPLWLPALTPVAEIPSGRQRVVALPGVEAPQPLLQDLVDESFLALRERLAAKAGWDFLSILENAFVPLTSPLGPGMGDDWLYTGRAFAVNTLPLNAGWMAVVRQDFGSQTYWRVYLRTRFQDGSQGAPLHSQPWNFNARYTGDPHIYEQGGSLAESIPGGYWLDLTQLAAAYGWERQPALNTWRSAYPSARFNEFVLSDRLDWRSAMLEIYPPEVLLTPTALVPTAQPPTPTAWPTRTPFPTRTPYPSRTPVPTVTPDASTANATQ